MSDPNKRLLGIRAVTPADIPDLVALNCAAYPDLIQDEVVWTEPQLRSHLVVFPEGQLLAEEAGRPVGAISTLILHRDIDPLAPHTWLGVTDNGYFIRHDPGGDTLYLADIFSVTVGEQRKRSIDRTERRPRAGGFVDVSRRVTAR